MHRRFLRNWNLLVRYLRPQWLAVLVLTLLLFANIVLQLFNPQVISFFIDTAQTHGPLQVLFLAARLFLFTALLQRAVGLAFSYLAESTSWKTTNALRADLTLHCLQLDLPFHKKHTPGELIERIDQDVTMLANFFSQFALQLASNALLILGILIFLFTVDQLLGIALVGYTCLVFAVLALFQKRSAPFWKAERMADADHYAFLEEHVQGTEDIRSAGAEPYITQRLVTLMHRMLETHRRARLVSNTTYVSSQFLFLMGYALGLGLGAFLYVQGQISLGTAYVIMYYIGMLSGPLESIRTQFQDLQRSTASIDRVEELLHTQPQVLETMSASLPAGPLSVTMQHVSFRYEVQEPVLHDISFSLAPGQVLGLLGRTGSGKSTLARLLFRLYDPISGSIQFADTDLRTLALDDIRSHIGMVTQDIQLFQASIRDNLTFFSPQVSDEQIMQVLTTLKLRTWLASLPNGLDTMIGANGQGLSAGESQLLAFARVFLKDPGLVVLDEASSRLDPATEALLEQALDQLLAQRTGIIIAHRLQTVQRANFILLLDQGNIIEYGPRLSLMRNPASHFSRLLQSGLEEVLA
ncbi:ABC transporter ATP-binding protein [Tengunoibacter tsumagoiensis]|uniref:Helicase n=1 Tax=Tengunoibacter tsumagoiensis TaxID=2014871 RepID=A0A402A822_9CHLR|nr:ABC transporter ATP-binding protein [Tengunoibacter tsumagoiensis]GCE15293.1 helicase [Tengunoibacter tsumagoiensis]